jgi:hypothetical protein
VRLGREGFGDAHPYGLCGDHLAEHVVHLCVADVEQRGEQVAQHDLAVSERHRYGTRAGEGATRVRGEVIEHSTSIHARRGRLLQPEASRLASRPGRTGGTRAPATAAADPER